MRCISPAEFQHFAGVAEIMRSEARDNAEKQLRLISENVIEDIAISVGSCSEVAKRIFSIERQLINKNIK